VIDDNANVRRSVRQVLKIAGWSVEQAIDGKAGLRMIERRLTPYALVITDLQMPQIDGRLVAETLGQCRPGQAVLCISGSASECRSVGPHDTAFPFLAKPFTQQALHQAVAHAIERAPLDRQAREAEQSRARDFPN
jgi:DNA-binding NtrC family response regulator